MSFSSAEKTQIRRTLGVPLTYNDSYLDVTARIQQLEQVSTNEDAARVILTDCATIESKLRSSWGRLAVKSVDNGGVVLGHWDEVTGLRNEGRRLATILAAMLDLEVHGFPTGQGVFGGGVSSGRVVQG